MVSRPQRPPPRMASASYDRPLVVVSLSTINRHYLADEFIGSIIDI